MLYDKGYFEQRELLEDNGHLHQVAVRVCEFFPGTVLDIGCGLGWIIKHLRANNIEAYGVDISPFAKENRACEFVECRDFRDEEGVYDTLVASKFLQCLTDLEVREFAAWSLKHCRGHLLILNSPGVGAELTRTTQFYEKVFTDHGWVVDECSYRRLHEVTGWDCLVLAKVPVEVPKRASLDRKHLTTSLIIDCWSGTEQVRKFANHISSVILPDTELVLVNVARCVNLSSVVIPISTKTDIQPAKFVLRGSRLPVILVGDEFRSTTAAFCSGLKEATGSVILFMDARDQLSGMFVPRAICKLLTNPHSSFVTPWCFFKGLFGGSDYLVSKPPQELGKLTALYGDKVNLPNQVSLYCSTPLTLSDLVKVDHIPPIFLARAEDLLNKSFDGEQQVFANQDLIFSLVHEGKVGLSDNGSSCFVSPDPLRFAPEEIEAGKRRLTERSRELSPAYPRL